MTEPNTLHAGDRPKVSLLLLVFIAFSGTLAMHVFVPALPRAAAELHASSQTIQLAITVYILGLALGQLIYGPLSDAIGRRKAILAALSIFILGGVGSALAPTADMLLVARFVQALGGAGGLSLTRVVVADTSKGAEATKGIAILNMILLLGPGLAPVIGAQISELFGWRMIFVALILMATSTLIVSIVKLPETGQPTRQLSAKRAFDGFASLLSHKKFLRIATGGAFGSTACYGYFVSAPFILGSDMGLKAETVGYCVGATLAAAAAGTLLTRSLVGKVSDRAILRTFSGLGLATGTVFLVAAVAHLLTITFVVVLSLLLLFSAGGLGPVTMGTALRVAGREAGSAAGLYGCFQMVSGVICSFVASLFANHEIGCGVVLCLGYAFCFWQLAHVKMD